MALQQLLLAALSCPSGHCPSPLLAGCCELALGVRCACILEAASCVWLVWRTLLGSSAAWLTSVAEVATTRTVLLLPTRAGLKAPARLLRPTAMPFMLPARPVAMV